MSEYNVKSSVNYMAHNLLCYDFCYYSLKVYHFLFPCLLPSFSVSHTPSSCESSSSRDLGNQLSVLPPFSFHNCTWPVRASGPHTDVPQNCCKLNLNLSCPFSLSWLCFSDCILVHVIFFLKKSLARRVWVWSLNQLSLPKQANILSSIFLLLTVRSINS